MTDLEIVTPRLLLRPPLPGDAPSVLKTMLDPDTARWNPQPTVTDEAAAIDWCTRMADWSNGDHATWHAVDASSGEFVGIVSVFAIDADHRTGKVGYRIAPVSRGQGFGSEALRAVTMWAFVELPIERIQLEHAVQNPASCGVAVRAGYRLEGVLRSSYRLPDGSRDDEHVHGRVVGDPD